MSYCRQILIEILSHKNRSILFGLLVATFVSFMCFGLYLRGFITNLYAAFASEEGYRIDINMDAYYCYDDWKNVFRMVDKTTYIEGFNNSTERFIHCHITGKANESDIYLSGNVNIEYSDNFRSGNLCLLSGNYPEEGKKQIIVEDEYSKDKNIAIGDYVNISYNDIQEHLLVVGIYDMDAVPRIDENNNGYYSESRFPIVFCDYLSYEALSGDNDFKILSVYVDSFEHMDDTVEELKDKLGDRALIVNTIENHANSTGTTINVFTKLSNVFIIASLLIFTLCMCLLSLIWIRDHIGTILILKALGQKNIWIIIQLLAELFAICIPVALIAVAINCVVYYNMGERITDFVILTSGNNMLFWDIFNNELLYNFTICTFLLPVMIVLGTVIIMSLTAGSILVNKNYMELKTIESNSLKGR